MGRDEKSENVSEEEWPEPAVGRMCRGEGKRK
jgi:hypothetical protein